MTEARDAFIINSMSSMFHCNLPSVCVHDIVSGLCGWGCYMPMRQIRDHPALNLARPKKEPSIIATPRHPRLRSMPINLFQSLQHPPVEQLWPQIPSPIRKYRCEAKSDKRWREDFPMYWPVMVFLIRFYNVVLEVSGFFPFHGLRDAEVVGDSGGAGVGREGPSE